ncbi:MAG: class I SAM-dependent methyltransferase [Chryseobacterium sp.]|nr:MAG: class I SAM-dependent methyltransferase [Chryseobacterium sp.]
MQDLPGRAIYDYHFGLRDIPLYVHDRFGFPTEMPVSAYFRDRESMPELEQRALDLCRGKVLDIGAAAGSHVLELQRKRLDVHALELSPASCEVMVERGVRNVICTDVFNYGGETFDSLLMMMNGIGLSSDIAGLRCFLQKADELLKPHGRLIFDSCDITYMYEEIDKPKDHYFGEVNCRYQYGRDFTDFFKWLYIDKKTMSRIADEEGWKMQVVYEDDQDQYLAVLAKK